MSNEGLRIGDLARATNTKVETIRYYEQIGLLPAPSRTSGNFRAYAAELRIPTDCGQDSDASRTAIR